MIPTMEDIIRGLLDGTMTHAEAAKWLAQHQRMQEELDGSDVSPTTAQVLLDLIRERGAQDKKWGEQNHASFDPVLSSWDGGAPAERMANEYEIPGEARAKFLCQKAFAEGQGTWMHILVEEIAEACGSYDKPDKLREELVQVAAVVVAWIEMLDRKKEKAHVG